MIAEASDGFDCFGGCVTLSIRDERPAERLAGAREMLLDAHRRLSRFDPESELSRLNRDPRGTVPASAVLRALTRAAREAGELSGGLVDASLLEQIERLGYVENLKPGERPPIGPGDLPPPTPAGPSPAARWKSFVVDDASGSISRPPGVKLDGGGIAKGLLADLVAERLIDTRAFAVDCCGDISVGGQAGLARRIRVEDPFGGPPVHELSLRAGGVATSGTNRRTWLDPDDRPAHQIIDPATGRPCATGIVQATAVAESALHAEVRAKAALLSGPEKASSWLPFGGVIVLAEGAVEVYEERADLPTAAVA